ncbi:hypothetical protein [Uliginosibacterium sp. H1]|uniref:hypothetical protein n=1 Tax=Uliginosibacterium sp. H1 TaxID=3114757 RepID=UPI002E19B668|nr:hypothetical protein [Uliginosibacterium sp. H1]
MARLRRYTIHVEHDGGSYISQVTAEDEDQAIAEWCLSVKRLRVYERGSKGMAKAVALGVANTGLTEVETTHKVWCFTAMHADKLVLGYVIYSGAAKK